MNRLLFTKSLQRRPAQSFSFSSPSKPDYSRLQPWQHPYAPEQRPRLVKDGEQILAKKTPEELFNLQA